VTTFRGRQRGEFAAWHESKILTLLSHSGGQGCRAFGANVTQEGPRWLASCRRMGPLGQVPEADAHGPNLPEAKVRPSRLRRGVHFAVGRRRCSAACCGDAAVGAAFVRTSV